MIDEELLHARPWQDQAAERAQGHDVGDRRLAQDDRHLAEEVAPGQSSTLGAIDDDRRFTVQDHVEARAGEALPEDAFTLGEHGFLERVHDARELRIGQIGEQREPGNRIDQVFTTRHGGMVPDGRAVGKLIRVDGTGRAAQHLLSERVEGYVTLTRERTTELLARTQLFAGVDENGLRMIAERIHELDVPADRVIARQGEIGTGFYVIAEGSVRVVRDGETIAELGPGDFFGELSVLDGKPRNAQVISSEPTICLALATWEFEEVVMAQPKVALAILRELAGRLRESTDAHRH